jgi:hypothetical protein
MSYDFQNREWKATNGMMFVLEAQFIFCVVGTEFWITTEMLLEPV